MPFTGTGNVLGAAIKAAIDGVGDKTDRTALFNALGTAIANYLVSQGAGAVLVASVAGVTTGPGVSGPGIGSLS